MKNFRRRIQFRHVMLLGTLLPTLALIMFGFTNCSGGFIVDPNFMKSSFASEAGYGYISQGKTLYAQNCATCHGAVEGSQKRNREASLISGAIQSVPQMSGLQRMSSTEIYYISLALSDTPPTMLVGGRNVYVCDPTQTPVTPALKLTNREFTTAIKSLLNDFSPAATVLSGDATLTALIAGIPSDVLVESRSTRREQANLTTKLMISSYFDVAAQASVVASKSAALGNYPNTAGCLASTPISQTCHQMFVKEFAGRAFRRTLNTSEASFLAAKLWDSTLSKEELFQLTFTAITQMPDFMYKVYDHGAPSPRGAAALTLTPQELAAKVAFLITGEGPDATLKSLAESGQIATPAILSAQVDRLFATAPAKENIKRLFRESYGYDLYDTFSYSDNFAAGIPLGGLQTSMMQELDTFFPDIVLAKSGSWSDVMTSKSTAMPNADLAAVYGVAVGTTTLPDTRAGFLNRAAFLTKRSGNYTTPVKRGLNVLESVLCRSVGNPPPSAPTAVPEPDGTATYHTTRERYAGLTEVVGSTCIACHARMNSLGYPFESFDSLGRLRTTESIYTTPTGPAVASLPIVTSSTVMDLSATPTAVANSADLARQLSSNDRAMMCFTQHLKNFEARVEVNPGDACLMNASLKTMYGSNGQQGSIKDAIKNYIFSDDFKIWSY